jgi:hypothetical protein
MSLLKRIWCALRGHPYGVRIVGEKDYGDFGVTVFQCKNCGGRHT